MDAGMRGAPARVHVPSWFSVFSTGFILWIASVIVTAHTGNLNLIPTVVLLGSFLIPVTAVVWYLDHYEGPQVTPRVMFSAFIIGGVLGVLAASILESGLRRDNPLLYVAVGLIEEFAKLLGLLFISRGLAY
jgi:protease PrsW